MSKRDEEELREFKMEMPTLVEDLGLVDSGKYKKRMGVYRCSCGEVFKTTHSAIETRKIKNCRACGYLKASKSMRKHSGKLNGVAARLYTIWQNMKARCLNKNNKDYDRYGGRGITICKEWQDSFELFSLFAKDNGYSDSLEIDRIDNELGYSPDNCWFVTHKVNHSNRDISINNRFSEDELSEILEMLVRGYTQKTVSEITGLSRSSIQRMVKEL